MHRIVAGAGSRRLPGKRLNLSGDGFAVLDLGHAQLVSGLKVQPALGLAVNRPGFELTPRSWTFESYLFDA